MPGGLLTEFTMSNSDPVHDIHIVRQDQEALFNAGEIFTPDFLSKTSNWSVLRFMDWNLTNGSTTTSWDERTPLSAAHWNNVPIEVEVALANKTHSDMWFNIPAMATDDYVRQFATYVRDNLDPTLKLHLEYSNETWNTGFSQTSYVQSKAEDLWGHDLWFGNEIYYGYRAAQIMTIAKDVFGSQADSRFSGVLAAFTGYTGVETQMLEGVNRAGLGSVPSLFKELAITTYFGDQLSSTVPDDQAKILRWADGGSAGMDAAFNELNHGGALSSNFSIDNLANYWRYFGQVASTQGLELTAYEGGFSSYWFAWPADAQPKVVGFVQRLLADPRFGDLYTHMVQEFTAAGGTELTAYADVGQTTIWGPWGTLATIYDDSPRYEALVAASGRGSTDISTPPTTVPVTPSQPVTPTQPVTTTPSTGTTQPADSDPTHTTSSNVTMAADATTLTYTGTGDFTVSGNPLANTITGGDHGNHLYGLGGDDILTGGAGADYLDGGMGADRMIGGAGDDVYIVDNAGDVVVENAGGGTDEVRTTLNTYALPDNVENLTFTGTGDFHGTGNALHNVITGKAGNDVLDGGGGADRLIGGLGNDVYIVDNVGDVVVENANEGTDEVRTTLAAYTLGDNVETLTFTGSGAFTGTGNALNNVIHGGDGGNVLSGGAGSDILYGGAGNDTLDGGSDLDAMFGGAGDDTYVVDNFGDMVVEDPGQGTDLVLTTLGNYTLGDNVENLTFIGSGTFNGTGNMLDNVIRGGDGGNQLSGGAGNDMLYGGAGSDYLFGATGNDLLDGGAGNDVMYGGAGDDTYVVDNSGDMVVENANEGVDLVRTTLASYTLGVNVENLTYTGNSAFTGLGNELDNVITGAAAAANKLYGGDGNDTLYGGSAADYLDGGNGVNTMVGGDGNDVYIVHDTRDVVVEQANGGLDEVRSYAASYTLAANVEVLTFLGSGDFTGTGNGDDNMITGGAGNDHLHGGAGNDTLMGGAGNDWLDGGTGSDRMIGGVGDDTYIVDDANDRIYENVGEGYDTIYSSVSYAMPAEVERLILTGMGNINATGNNGANTLIGNAGSNTLSGGAGNDILIGGGGGDTLTGGTGADTFVFQPGDMIQPGQMGDWITDFNRTEGDRIDLSALRAAGGPALSFLGTAAFDHHAGQVRMEVSGANADVSLDLDGDGVADVHFAVTSRSGVLVASDFLL